MNIGREVPWSEEEHQALSFKSTEEFMRAKIMAMARTLQAGNMVSERKPNVCYITT